MIRERVFLKHIPGINMGCCLGPNFFEYTSGSHSMTLVLQQWSTIEEVRKRQLKLDPRIHWSPLDVLQGGGEPAACRLWTLNSRYTTIQSDSLCGLLELLNTKGLVITRSFHNSVLPTESLIFY